jgi:hypothetical protein
MKLLKFLFTVVLFYALIPGVLVRLPPGASPMVVNLTHAVVFALICRIFNPLKFLGLGGK